MKKSLDLDAIYVTMAFKRELIYYDTMNLIQPSTGPYNLCTQMFLVVALSLPEILLGRIKK